MVSLTVIAPIKLNLNLHIVGIRHDNYHLLEGVTVFLDDGDIINIAENPDNNLDNLTINGAFAQYLQHGKNADNLIIKAIKLLRTVKYFPFLTITLEKNIPIQAGYGGGSSDAAAVLKGINQLYNLNISFNGLIHIGKSLGADVPMCIYAKPCFIENIGDKITPIRLHNKSYACLLLKPNFMLSTHDVFKALSNKHNPKMPKTDNVANSIIDYALHYGRNDLWQAAVHLRPELDIYLQALCKTNPIKSGMSGSGSGLFALYDTEKILDSAYDTIKAQFTENFIKKTKFNF
jgi:4-diphosphocytidyl-2-C-methyl-D-erythritol kinase